MNKGKSYAQSRFYDRPCKNDCHSRLSQSLTERSEYLKFLSILTPFLTDWFIQAHSNWLARKRPLNDLVLQRSILNLPRSTNKNYRFSILNGSTKQTVLSSKLTLYKADDFVYSLLSLGLPLYLCTYYTEPSDQHLLSAYVIPLLVPIATLSHTIVTTSSTAALLSNLTTDTSRYLPKQQSSKLTFNL